MNGLNTSSSPCVSPSASSVSHLRAEERLEREALLDNLGEQLFREREVDVADAVEEALGPFQVVAVVCVDAQEHVSPRVCADQANDGDVPRVSLVARHPLRAAADLDLERPVAQLQPHVDLALEAVLPRVRILRQQIREVD
jgi:hypothetical protein